jgi:hypothetical protein
LRKTFGEGVDLLLILKPPILTRNNLHVTSIASGRENMGSEGRAPSPVAAGYGVTRTVG